MNLNLKKSILYIFVLIPLLAQSQTAVKGTIKDDKGEVIPYAIVMAYTMPDSAILKTEVADSAGNYILNIQASNEVLLKGMATGYNTAYRVLKVQEGEQVANVMLQAATQKLKGVTVSARKPLIERKIDRTIFNVESSVTSAGTDAFELMKKAPGVRVNNNTISIAGKSTVSVMLNDRIIPMTGDELEAMLRSIPADNISRLEVITAPPAKYDAAGNSGIINIVTKKQNTNGFNGSVTATYQQRRKASERLEGNFNWRMGKWNIYGNTSVNNYCFTSDQRIETYYTGQQQIQNLYQQNRPLYTRNQIGADYYLNKKSVIGILYTYGSTYRDMDQLYMADVISLPARIKDSIMRTFAYSYELADRNVVDLNYEYKIDTNGKKLNIDVEFFSRWNDKRRNINTRSLWPTGEETGTKQYNRTTGIQKLNYQTVKADLLLPYKYATLSIGGKASFIDNKSDNIFTYYNGGSQYVTDNNKTNAFNYQERIQAAYISAQKEWDKWEGQAGLRAEYTQTKGVSKTTNQTNTNEYFKLFPTAYLQYHPNDENVLNINYGKRINRPEFWDMNPFRQYMTDVSYEEGNPFLQPSFSHNIEAGYTYKDKYTFTAYTNFEKAIVTRVSRIDSTNNSYNFVMANAGKSKRYGMSATGMFYPAKWWEIHSEIYAYYNKFSSDFYKSAFASSIPTASLMLNNIFTLNKSKTLIGELTVYGITDQQSDFDRQRSFYTTSIGMRALFFNKRLVISANFNDPFRSDIWYVGNLVNGTIQEGYFDSRSLFVSVNWKFGNKYIKDKRQRNTSSEESSRAN